MTRCSRSLGSRAAQQNTLDALCEQGIRQRSKHLGRLGESTPHPDREHAVNHARDNRDQIITACVIEFRKAVDGNDTVEHAIGHVRDGLEHKARGTALDDGAEHVLMRCVSPEYLRRRRVHAPRQAQHFIIEVIDDPLGKLGDDAEHDALEGSEAGVERFSRHARCVSNLGNRERLETAPRLQTDQDSFTDRSFRTGDARVGQGLAEVEAVRVMREWSARDTRK